MGRRRGQRRARGGRFRAIDDDGLPPTEVVAPAPGANGAVRLAYRARTGMLGWWYDGDGPVGDYQWTLLHQIPISGDPGGWDLPPGTLLTVETGGHSSGPAIPAATLWLDDFAVDSQATVEPHLYHLRRSETNVFLTGAADPGVPVVLQASDQLGSWIDVRPLVTPESGQLLFTVPHDGKNAQFYRLRH